MDFFEHQEVARRKTSVLVGYYALAVTSIMVAVYLVITLFVAGAEVKAGVENAADRNLWNPALFLGVMAVTGAIVLGGTLFKIAQLAGGGEAVARMLGGRPVEPGSADADERKILNVVEEMAIASGTPVPRVFILDEEDGINAFAAGWSTANAVVAVTRGCVRRLTRDELQGVVAHEFSHILNGDMRLNIRLIGVLNGILVIAMIGYALMRSASLSSGSRSRSRGKNGLPLILLGLLLMAIGYIGVFFGRLIKSAVSRQREFLADASAVQFTRNPDGIAGALKKIAGYTGGSRLESPQAEEASHFFFANGLAGSWIDLMATHPPLEERIRRLDPSFDGELRAAAEARPVAEAAAGLAGIAAARPARIAVDSAGVLASVGAPTPEHLAFASRLLAGLPAALVAAARDPLGARAVLYGLLLASDAKVRAAQLADLARGADPAAVDETQRLLPLVEALGPADRLPLLDLAISALKALSADEYLRFKGAVQRLAAADQRIDLFEYTLQRTILRQLDPVFVRQKPPVVQYYDLRPLLGACGELLSCLAYWGAEDEAAARRAFDRAAARLHAREPLTLSPYAQSGLPQLDHALGLLAQASPAVKRAVLDACVDCVAADGHVTPEEAELLRAVAAALDCPVPPFLPGPVVRP